MSLCARSSRFPIPTLCLALALSACGGGGSGSAGDDADTDDGNGGGTLQEVLAKPLGTRTSCPNLVLSRTSAVPGEEVVVSGLPPEFGGISLRVIAETENGETVVDPLFVSTDDESGEIAFSAPLHPTGDPEGGQVKLEPGDGELHCPQQTFVVEPLPSAPADYPVTIAEDFERWADLSIQALGYDPETLLNADPDTLPKARLSLWLVKQFVSSDREDALPALARQARDDENNRVARLLMASGLEQELEQAIMELNMTPRARLELRPLNQASRMIVRSSESDIDAPVSASTSPAASCEEQAFDPDELQIDTAAELSSRLQAADDGTLLSDAENTAVGRTLGSFSLADSSGSGGAASGYIGTSQVVGLNLEAARLALEPQRITEFRVERVQQEWVEDRPSTDLLFWDNARVRAEGNTFNLGEATLQTLVSVVGLTPGPLGTATTAASTVAPNAVNNVISDLTEDSCVRIRAPEYGPIDVDDPQWTESEIVGSTVELAGDGHQEYRGVDIGASTLEIDLRADPFALVAPMTEPFIIDVVQVNTSRIPRAVNIQEPGEPVELSVTATNPHQPDNRDNYTATLPEGNGVILDQRGDGTQYNVSYRTPENREDYPTEVLFTANHMTLPAGSNPRTYPVEVDIGGDLSIDQGNVCLTPGQDKTFTATLDGFADDNQSVSWQASAGSINSTGDLMANYQAPGSPAGSVEITAVADADDSVTDTVTITVSNNCIEKKWFPSARISLDGSGVYPPNNTAQGSELCTDATTNPPEQEASIVPDDMPGPYPGDYWFGRTEDLSAQFGHSSTRFIYNDAGECRSADLSGTNSGDVEYFGAGDTLSASIDSSLMYGCGSYPNGNSECVSGGNGMLLNGAFYIDLAQRRAYTLEGELSCSGTEGSFLAGSPTASGGSGGMSAQVLRFDAAGDPVVLDQSTGVENPNGTLRSPRLYGDVTCDEPGQVVPFSVDFVLTAPPEGEVHRVVISLLGGIAIGPSIPGVEFGEPPTAPVPAGTYSGEAEIDFSIRLLPN